MAKFTCAFVLFLAVALQSTIAAPAPQPLVWNILQSVGNSMVQGAQGAAIIGSSIVQNGPEAFRYSLKNAIESAQTLVGGNSETLRAVVQTKLNASRQRLSETAEQLKATLGDRVSALQQVGTDALSRVLVDVQSMYDNINTLATALKTNVQDVATDKIRLVIEAQANAADRLSEAANRLVGNQITADEFKSTQLSVVESIVVAAGAIITDTQEALRPQVELLQQPIAAALKVLNNVPQLAGDKVADLKEKLNQFNGYLADVAKDAAAQATITKGDVMTRVAAYLNAIRSPGAIAGL